MKVFITLVAILLAALPSEASAQEPASVADLAWLAGCWARIEGEIKGEFRVVDFPMKRTEQRIQTAAKFGRFALKFRHINPRGNQK